MQHVKLIVNNIEGANEEKVFGNLNSKRIPLDGADLVRAILITRVAKEESERERDEVNIKNIVRQNERRVRIGWELDEINAWWNRQEVSSYFEKFTSIKKLKGDINFQSKYPINLLLKLYAEKQGKDTLSLDLIEQVPDALDLYKDLIKLHNTLTDWYKDREIYHYLGYLFFQIEIEFNKIWLLWSNAQNPRAQFKRALKKLIKDAIFEEDEDFEVMIQEKNWYDDQKETLVKILLLLDVIYSLNRNQLKLPTEAFSKKSSDVEHIFPRNPQRIQDKKEYIDFLNKHFTLEEPFDLTEFELRQEEVEYQDLMEEFIKKQTENIEINSIGNLVLLYDSLNRSLKNNSYGIKRARIIEYFLLDERHFIQPHTFKVFIRYFNTNNEDMKDLEHWTNKDIQMNANAIKNTLKDFFKTTESGDHTNENQ